MPNQPIDGRTLPGVAEAQQNLGRVLDEMTTLTPGTFNRMLEQLALQRLTQPVPTLQTPRRTVHWMINPDGLGVDYNFYHHEYRPPVPMHDNLFRWDAGDEEALKKWAEAYNVQFTLDEPRPAPRHPRYNKQEAKDVMTANPDNVLTNTKPGKIVYTDPLVTVDVEKMPHANGVMVGVTTTTEEAAEESTFVSIPIFLPADVNARPRLPHPEEHKILNDAQRYLSRIADLSERIGAMRANPDYGRAGNIAIQRDCEQLRSQAENELRRVIMRGISGDV
jgi:hypothetical protein